MKRETRNWLKAWAETVGRHGIKASCAQDALDSDARQRAEIRRIRTEGRRLVEKLKRVTFRASTAGRLANELESLLKNRRKS